MPTADTGYPPTVVSNAYPSTPATSSGGPGIRLRASECPSCQAAHHTAYGSTSTSTTGTSTPHECSSSLRTNGFIASSTR
ncbi:hypothetical protein SAMN04488000_12910 [Lentzea albida]|uniref:Uncharacterized protein n=1 Tax=Lentzea albida TaxID=65499 RepID=A0A1H9X744_9PSEU|nr:hypothetical protein SAMN04488000_12910 [Lentzea albida]